MMAYIESVASEIPIWHITKEDPNGMRHPITCDGDWNERWDQAMALREAEPEECYDVETTVLN